MGSIIDAIAEDIELYKDLCSHYGEKFVENRVYTSHYTFLKGMYKLGIEPYSEAFVTHKQAESESWAQTEA